MERREEPLGNSFYRCFGSVFFGKEGRGFLGLGMLSGFWSSAPDLTPPMRVIALLWLFVWCGCVGCELYSGREHL